MVIHRTQIFREAQVDPALRTIAKFLHDKFPKRGVQIDVRAHKNRSVEQNALSHAWYRQVAVTEKEYTEDEIKCFCKLRYGAPILRAEDADFNEVCVVLDRLPYEERLKIMRRIPVTSEMSTEQMSAYLERVQQHYAGRVPLEFPGDW